ncbi:retrotransposon protein, putative, ty1-copia subclass [Tanacetum coccineum]
MHGMGKTVTELHAMLKLHEQTPPKKVVAPALYAIRAGKILPPPKKDNPAKDTICHQCGDVGHCKRNYPQYLTELLKNKKISQGASTSSIFTIELYTFPNNTWVYNTGCGTHVCMTTQGLRRSRKLKLRALSLAIPRNGIFEIDLSNSNINDSSMYAVSNKRAKINLDSTLLSHCHLGHISKKCIEKLQHDGLLNSTNNQSFDKFVSCMSRKMARKPYAYQVERAKYLLGLIHIDVCGPFRTVSKQGAIYFITFTKGFSHYDYVYLQKHKHEVFKTFKVFQKEVENQLWKTIKSLHSDRGGEYMSQEFLDHLKEHGIISHRTHPCTPQHNGVSERRNRTLLDMVCSMMTQTTLPKSFWDYALESAARILNMVPTKKVEKTPHEICHGQSPKLSYLKVWGCEALETMGYSFYYPPENKIFVARNAEFLKKSLITQEASRSLEYLEMIKEEDTHPSANTSLDHDEDDQEINEPQSDINPICRSIRTRRAPDRMCLYIDAEEHELGDHNEPTNYKAALLDPKYDKWLDAMNVEMQSMKDNEVWDLVDLPPDGKTVGSKRLFKKRTDMDGVVHTYKARLVAKGFTQTYGVGYEETFSPVADIRAIRILVAITASYDYEIWKMDVKNAFLNGHLFEEVYMVQPEGFVNLKYPNRVCKLKCSIYGLKQASRQWNKRFDDEIKCFAMKDLGEAAYILGIKIYRDRSRRLISLCQSAYIEKIFRRFYMENSKCGSIPMQEKLKLSKSQGASTPAEVKRMQNIPYASAMGSIIYTVRCTHHDVAFSQNITSRFQQNLGDLHWTVVKNILKYLRNTKDMFLTGYVFILNGGAVDWKITKQSLFATSFVEVEYIAAYDASKEAVWIRKFSYGLGVVPTIEEPIRMYCDNTGSITIANESVTNKGARHYHAKVHYLCEVIELGDVKIEKVHTDDNLDDPFTKALPLAKHSEHSQNIGMLPGSGLM